MLKRRELLLLEDYKISLQLLQHENERKASLFNVFFLIQGGLFGFHGWIYSSNKLIAILISCLAAVFCVLWLFIIERQRAFIWLRYLHLRQIEKDIGVITTMTEEGLLRDGKTLSIAGTSYRLGFHQKLSVSRSESVIPILVGFFWSLIAIVSFLSFVVDFLSAV